jgi:hypothetical protein
MERRSCFVIFPFWARFECSYTKNSTYIKVLKNAAPSYMCSLHSLSNPPDKFFHMARSLNGKCSERALTTKWRQNSLILIFFAHAHCKTPLINNMSTIQQYYHLFSTKNRVINKLLRYKNGPKCKLPRLVDDLLVKNEDRNFNNFVSRISQQY